MGFLSKNPSKNKKVHKNCFDKQEKSSTYLKMFWKKQKKFKAIWAVLGNSETKIFSVGQPWWPTFFQESNAHSYMAQNHSHVGLKVFSQSSKKPLNNGSLMLLHVGFVESTSIRLASFNVWIQNQLFLDGFLVLSIYDMCVCMFMYVCIWVCVVCNIYCNFVYLFIPLLIRTVDVD